MLPSCFLQPVSSKDLLRICYPLSALCCTSLWMAARIVCPSKYQLLKQAEVDPAPLLSQLCIAFFFLLYSQDAQGSCPWFAPCAVLQWHGCILHLSALGAPGRRFSHQADVTVCQTLLPKLIFRSLGLILEHSFFSQLQDEREKKDQPWTSSHCLIFEC